MLDGTVFVHLVIRRRPPNWIGPPRITNPGFRQGFRVFQIIRAQFFFDTGARFRRTVNAAGFSSPVT